MPATEAERVHFMNLDFGLPLEQLRPSIRACLAGELQRFEQELEAINRGRPMACRVSGSALVTRREGGPRGVILFMEDRSRQTDGAGASRRFRQSLIER